MRLAPILVALAMAASVAMADDGAKPIAEVVAELEALVAAYEAEWASGPTASAVAAQQEQLKVRKATLEAQIAADRAEIARLREEIGVVARAALQMSPPVTIEPPMPGEPLASREVTPPLLAETSRTEDRRADLELALDGLETPLAGRDPGFLRRILTRPGAAIRTAAGGAAIPAPFSIYYVYAERSDAAGNHWLAIGETASGPTGWISHEQTEDWRSMLVMEYAARTDARKPVLFFRSDDDLRAVIEDRAGDTSALDLYADLAAGGNAAGRIVTVEPHRGTASDALYLLPVLDFSYEIFAYGGAEDVTLLQLVGLTGDTATRAQTRAEETPQPAQAPPASDRLRDFRIGVAFVINTTISMGPYIEATKDFVLNVYGRLDALGIAQRFRIGIVGFRDNVTLAPGASYVTRIYRDLREPDLAAIARQIQTIEAARVPTRDWREDSFAGLRSAAYDLDWGEVDAKIIVLVTDASARDVGDDAAQFGAFGAASVRAIMEQNDIRVITTHLRTEEARRAAGNSEILRGEAQYRELGIYLPVEGDTARAFGRALDGVENTIVDTLAGYAAGIERSSELDEDERLELLSVLDGGAAITVDNAALAARPIASEIFRAQQAYLGEFEGAVPPKFYRAWAADRDLVATSETALEVSVLVTRAQLEDIATGLDNLLRSIDDKERGLGAFFLDAQAESGRATTDPLMSDFTPRYLDALPYRSRLGSITVQEFLRLGQDQEAILNDVRAKLTAYREILRSDRRWMKVSEASEEQLYPLRLRSLP